MFINTFNNKKIRFHILWSLIFSFLLHSCKENKKEDRQISIEWKANKAIAISIPDKLLNGISPDAARKLLHVQLEKTDADMLGNNFSTIDAVIFRPIVAFTRGLKYEVYISDKLITSLTIPADENGKPPVVSSIYPSGRDVPENLLKMYIVFSKPMQEGLSLENVIFIKNERDTIPSIFLDLQPELWNKERTMLTLWLDPGRIKRDLQPNKKLGSPLEQGVSYQIVIKQDWRDAEGVSLFDTYRKEFGVGARDGLSPNPNTWTMEIPKAGSRQSLNIQLQEPLDYALLKNAIRVVDNKDSVVNGVIEVKANETILQFTPSATWRVGNYTIEIESRLEDLAGNNLNRLFDKDLTKKNTAELKDIYKRPFQIR